MSKQVALRVFVALAITTGCATEQQMLAKQEPEAVQTALARGRFDLNCPAATALVLSSDFVTDDKFAWNEAK